MTKGQIAIELLSDEFTPLSKEDITKELDRTLENAMDEFGEYEGWQLYLRLIDKIPSTLKKRTFLRRLRKAS
ncbi:MAG: hypothetical protein COC01_03930 [Bacteroidetes bacterium]|nr:MAG: hypothetical protein COC01_03930 [Bacteroidota bacterium]